MNKLRFLLLFFLNIFSITLLAQDNASYTADVMRGNGKIYVVVAVCLIILFGLILYVFRIDKKIEKLEKENK
jgi:hypothetical protein